MIEVKVNSRFPVQKFLKCLIDRISALLLIIALSPAFLLIGILIKIDDGGPVFFRQTRLGKDQSPFRIWKFRTMIVGADNLLGKGDKVSGNRITRIGRFLRLSSLDELPQLFNIFLGHMSFVGPRPILPIIADCLNKRHSYRFFMKPGITGLAQINGRTSLKFSQRFEYDIEYIDQFSLLLDLQILTKTVAVAFSRKGLALDRIEGNMDLPQLENGDEDGVDPLSKDRD